MYVDNKEAELATQIQEELHKVHAKKMSGTFFHEKTNSGFIQVNRIEGNSVQNGTPTPDNPIEVKSFDGEVVTSGKNLIDMDYLMNYFNTKLGRTVISKEADGSYKFAFNTNSNVFNNVIPITLDKNKRYAMRCKYKCPNHVWGTDIKFKFTDGTYGEMGEYNVYDYKEKAYIIPKGKVIESFYINSANGTGNPSYYKDFQLEVLEEGQEAPSSYEPFHATKTEKITLRSLPNGVKDTLERQLDGSYLLTQNLIPFEFDGSENWEISWLHNSEGLPPETSADDKTNGFTIQVHHYEGRSEIICDTFKTFISNIGENWRNIECIFTEENIENDDSKRIFVSIKHNRLNSTEISVFKEWLKAHPIKGHYHLATPITRKVWLSPLSAYEGMTNIFANSEVGAEMEVEVLTTNAVNGKLQELKENILQERPNPNLLVNADFRNLINTTGKTEFVKTKDGYSPVFDGWVYGGGKNNSTVKITNYGIELKAVDTGGIQIQQNFDEEFIKKISGNYLTISNESIDAKTRIVLKRNGIYTNIVVVEPGYTEATSLTKYTYIPGDLMYFAITDINGNLAKVKWAKLELGERATPLEYVSKAQKQLETGGVPLLYGGEEITKNADLNNYVNIGNYYCVSDGNAKTLKNAPTELNYGFTMTIKSTLGKIASSLESNYLMQKIETRVGQEYKREIVVPSKGDTFYGAWAKNDLSVVGSEVPKLKFLAQPQLLKSQQGTYKENVTMTVNGGKGIFAFNTSTCQIVGMNGKTGSVFKFLDVYGFKASTKMFEATSSSPEGILIVDGINKPVAFYPYKGIFTFFDGGSVASFDSIVAYASSSSGHVSVYKIAEFL